MTETTNVDTPELPAWQLPPGHAPAGVMIAATHVGVEHLPGPDGLTVAVLRLSNGIAEARIAMRPDTIDAFVELLTGIRTAGPGPRLVFAQPSDIPGGLRH